MVLKVFEAFAGVGSQRMALKKLGIAHEVVAISEIDKFAIKSYEAIHGTTLNLYDITKIDVEEIPRHDLFTYSFPCQDISQAGLKKGFEKNSGTRSSLLWHCEDIIRHHLPKYLLLENVKALVNKKNIEGFKQCLSLLEDLGYTNYWQVLNAKDYNVPQNRERVFCVSILGEHDTYVFPGKQILKTRLKDVLEEVVDEKYYLSDEQVEKLGKSTYHTTRDKLQKKDYCDTICARDYKDPKVVQIPRGFNNGGIKYICPTITKNFFEQNNFVLDSSENIRIRKITPKECWRLMGFLDSDFEKAQKVNSNSQLYKQAGNSIVVPILEEIFKNLFCHHAKYESEVVQMTLFPELNKAKTKKNAYKILESYRLLLRISGTEFSQKVTTTYSFEPRQKNHTVSNAIEKHVIRQLTAEKECEYIEQAINRVYNAHHRQLLIKKYCHKTEQSDISLYVDLHYSETEFYRELEKAVLTFAEVYKNGKLLVFENDLSVDEILGES